MNPWLRLLREREHFRRLWLSGTISLMGDWLSLVAVSVASLHSGAGATGLAITFALHALPGALFGPIAGVLADRTDRKQLLLLANVLQAVLTAAMVPLAMHQQLFWLQLVLLLRSAVAALVIPAEGAALRHVVHADELVTANALLSSTWSVTYCVGMALGGALLLLGPALALLLDAFSFLVAAWLLRALPAIAPSETSPAQASLQQLRNDLQSAWKHSAEKTGLRAAVLAKVPIAIAGGGAWITLNLLTDRLAPLGSAALSLGIFQAVRGAGMGLGSVGAEVFAARGGVLLREGSVWGAFVGMGVFALSHHPVVLLVSSLLWGMGAGSNWVFSTSDVQQRSDDAYVGRLTAIDNVFTTASFVLLVLVGGVVADRSQSITLATWIALLLGIVGWAWLAWKERALQKTHVGVVKVVQT